jgi:hypothetical protein
MLLAAGSSIIPIDFSDPMPDEDGTLFIAIADFGTTDESGAGVLSRIQFQALATGAAQLHMSSSYSLLGNWQTDARLSPDSGGIYFVDDVRSAVLSVGPQLCTEVDEDADQTPDQDDNCPLDANPDQLNSDADSRGDACDFDDDNDGTLDFHETIAGSDGTDAASQPEYFSVTLLVGSHDSCFDGVDNDLDGQADLGDDGCALIHDLEVPANDRFRDAAATSSFPFDGVSVWPRATTDRLEQFSCGGDSHTVWYKISPDQSITLKFRDTPVTAMAVYGNTRTGQSFIACEESDELELRVRRGTTVYVQLTRTHLAGLHSYLDVEEVPPPPPTPSPQPRGPVQPVAGR